MRRILKDKELRPMSVSDINKISSGIDKEVYIISPNQGNGYFLGYDGSNAISKNIDTNISTSLCERTYFETKLNKVPNVHMHLVNSGGNLYIYKESIKEIDSLPSQTITNVILSNTYNNVTRYLGVNGTSITSTQNQTEAANNEIYHWNMTYNRAGRFTFLNPKSNRYIRYSNSAFSLNTTGTQLYVNYTANNGFRLMGSNGSNYMYMSSNSALARNQYTAQYWHIYTNKISPNYKGLPISEELEELPVTTVENVIMSNTYNNVTRFMGINGTSVTSTTDIDEATNNDIYCWNLVFYRNGMFKIQSVTQTNRYIRYYNSAFSLNTTSSNLYFAYNETNKFTIMGSDGSNYMYISSNTALGRNQRTAQYWNIYKVTELPSLEWSFPKQFEFSEYTGDTTNIVAGYNDYELITINQNGHYLNHGNSYEELTYCNDANDSNNAFIIFDRDRTIMPYIEPTIRLIGAKYNYTEVETTWDIQYNYFDNPDKFDITVMMGGVHGGFLLCYEDDSRINATKIYWDSLVITNSKGQTVDVRNVSDIGWCSTTAATNNRQLINGGNIGIGPRTDIETGVSHPYAIGFTSGSDMTPTGALMFVFKGVTLQ